MKILMNTAGALKGRRHRSPPGISSTNMASEIAVKDEVCLSDARAKDSSKSWLQNGLMLTLGAVSLASAFGVAPAQAEAVQMTHRQKEACTLYNYLGNGNRFYYGHEGSRWDGRKTADDLDLSDQLVVDIIGKARGAGEDLAENFDEQVMSALLAPEVGPNCPSPTRIVVNVGTNQ